MNRVNPITLKYENGTTYTLMFDRATVTAAEDDGFKRTDAAEKLMTRVPQLFYFAFRAKHPEVTREETDRILFEDLGGVSEDIMGRLLDLFDAPYETLINASGKVKNPHLTVKL